MVFVLVKKKKIFKREREKNLFPERKERRLKYLMLPQNSCKMIRLETPFGAPKPFVLGLFLASSRLGKI